MNDVVVVKTGTANTASVLAALKRVGCAARLSAGAGEVTAASAVVLPGVGSFGAAMGELARSGLTEALRERVSTGRPTLCICLGLQVLARESDESPGVRGLAVIDASVTRFNDVGRVPHMGWNEVRWHARSAVEQDGVDQAPRNAPRSVENAPTSAVEARGVLVDGAAYFANSYKLDEIPSGWQGALSEHCTPFVAALRRDHVLACQFHPELSGPWGLRLIRNWVECSGVAPC